MKYIGKILIISITTLSIGLGLWYYLNKYLSKSKASNAIAHFAFSKTQENKKGGDLIHADLTVVAPSGMSSIDIVFNATTSNKAFLAFSYLDTVAHLPTGFELLLDESKMTHLMAGGPMLNRIIIVSKKSASTLPKSALIPLYFTVINSGQVGNVVLTADLSRSQVVGVSETGLSGEVFSLEGNAVDKIPTYTVSVEDPRAASVTNLECDIAANMSIANCGRGVSLQWSASSNAKGYRISKTDKNGVTTSLGEATATTFRDKSCSNFVPNIYSVIAYNADGSVSTTSPTVNCACLVCPTPMPPTPTPLQPKSSSDLIFRLIFPNTLSTINEIPNVKVTILDNEGKPVCGNPTDCEFVTSFRRVADAPIANTFISPQLQYPTLKKNMPYSVVVKQNQTVQRTFKFVYLKWQKVLQCIDGVTDSGCGELLNVSSRLMFSGDLDNSGVINQADLDIVSTSLGSYSAEGDVNFDGLTDQKDVEIMGKNFNKKGN